MGTLTAAPAFTCEGCGVSDSSTDHRGWSMLPPGWFGTSGMYEGENRYACSTECVDRCVEHERRNEEFRTFRDEEYGNTRRNDEDAEATARTRAERRMVRAYGKDWRDGLPAPGKGATSP